MLATRIVPVLLWDGVACVKGKQFDHSRRIGSIQDRVRLLEKRDIDELFILDVAATPNSRAPRFEELSAICDNLFCPVTIGGGIKTVHDASRLIRGGADKVCIGTAALDRPGLLGEIAEKFGRQAVVASIDVRADVNRAVHVNCGQRSTGLEPLKLAREMERVGAGEILLNHIGRDGTMWGYDLQLIRDVASAVSIPVVACGGCGTYEHMSQAIDAGAHAVAAGAMFQFTDQTPKGACRYLRERGYEVRV